MRGDVGFEDWLDSLRSQAVASVKTLSFNDRLWLLLAGCLAGLLAPFVASRGAGSLAEPVSAVAIIAAGFFVAYGVRRFLVGDMAEARQTNQAYPLGTADDPTRKPIDEPKGEYSQQLHDVFDGLETQVCILDTAGRIIDTNRAWDAFAEQATAGATGLMATSFEEFCLATSVYVGDGAKQIVKSVLSVTAEGGIQTITSDHAGLLDGVRKTYRVSVKSLPTTGRGAVVVMQQDLTDAIDAEQRLMFEKRRAETLASALETSQASLELAMKGGEIGLWHWDVATRYFELINGDWLQRLGCPNGFKNADVESFRELIHPDEQHVFWTSDDAASLAPDEPYDRQFRLKMPDGCYRWVQVLGRSNVTNPDGTPESLSGILLDIHDRKTAERRNAGMARIIEESINEVFITDQETLKFLEVNRGARENLGYSIEELRQLGPTDIKRDDGPEAFHERINKIKADPGKRLEIEMVHRRRDGTSYPIRLTMQTGRLLDRDVFVAIGSDLTEQKQLESQLVEAQRLESIGQLAAGVAHEMNTPLQFVGNNISFLSDCSDALFEVIDLCESQLASDPTATPLEQRRAVIQEAMERTAFQRIRTEAPKAIAESLEGIDRVLQIVRAMKEFSHPGEGAMVPTDLNRAITSTTTVTRSRWKTTAELELDLEANLPCVTCHGGSLNQVFVNLIVNASDAIADRAEKDPAAPAGRIQIRSRSLGDTVQIEVEDNGNGMPDEVQRRVFDPFFTTKEVGKGTGQGLSLSHTIITQKHDGSLTVHSIPGEGTIMRIVLPITPDTRSRETASLAAGTLTRG